MSVRDIIQAAAGSSAVETAWELNYASWQGIFSSGSIASYETTPADVQFNPDGTRMYILGDTRDAVLQYDLSTPYGPNTAFLPRKSVSAQYSLPSGIEFKPDGTKMYVIGAIACTVSEYDLSVAWDVTTATFVQSFNVNAQTGTNSLKVRFKDDGTKMYVLSETNDRVYQYSLSTAWNVSTATYDSVSFLISGQETVALGMCFGDSGAKMYIIGQGNDTVYQYNLSSAWDLSTATYSGLSFSVTAQETIPEDVFFKSDGTIMYVMGQNGDDVNQYALSTAWDVSTASLTQVSSPTFATIPGENTPRGIYIKSDGTQFYLAGQGGKSVYQQSMSSAWDVLTLASGYSVVSQDNGPAGLAFKSDGTKMYVLGSTNDTVYQYSLATAWNTLTATYDSVSFSVAAQETSPQGITFKDDGTKMYILGSGTSDSVYEYALSSAWVVSSASYTTSFSVASQTGALPRKVRFQSDGTKMFVLSTTNNAVYQYNLSSAWSVSSASYSGTSFGTRQSLTTGLAFSSNGAKIFFVGQSSDIVNGANLSTAWSLSTAQYYVATGLSDNYTFPLSSTGLSAITSTPTSSYMSSRALSTAWKVDTLGGVNGNLYIPTLIGYYPGRARYKSDGTSVYMNSPANNAIYQWNLSTPYNVGTNSYTGNSFSFSSQDTNARGFAFSDDGTKLYMIGGTNDTVYQYALSTAWDISTVSYASLSKSISAQETSPQAVFLGNSGTRMYIIGDANDTVYQYNLSTAWDVSTATYSGKSFSVLATAGTSPRDLFFRDNGEAFYVAGGGAAYQYTIG